MVLMVIFWILWITVLPIYISGVRGFGFFFPIFFFPFFGGYRNRRRSKPVRENTDSRNTGEEFQYINNLETEVPGMPLQRRNYIFYVIAAIIFAIALIIAFTNIL